jgi:hypothetical protein
MVEPWYMLFLTDDEDDAWERSLRVSEHNFFGVETWELKEGAVMKKWNPESWLRSPSAADDGIPFDVLAVHLCLPTFSPRLRSALSKVFHHDEVQWLPVRVIRHTGEELQGFSIANFLNPVMALDRSATGVLQVADEIDPATGEPWIRGLGRPALKREVLKARTVIRLLEYPYPIFVSEQVAAVFRTGHFTGASLGPVRLVP